MRVPTTRFQNSFGKYLQLAREGQEIIVTKNGIGVAKLLRFTDPQVFSVSEGAPAYSKRDRVSYEEFLEMTEKSEARFELINGQVYMMASPSYDHQIVVGEIHAAMHQYFKGKKCQPALSPFDVKLFNNSACFEDDPNVVQPDILVICDKENVNEKRRYEGIPSLIVEVLSPSTRSKDMLQKLYLYTLSGVKEYWIVDLKQRQIQLYTFQDRSIEKMIPVQLGEVIRSEFFEGLTVDTSEWDIGTGE